MSRTLYFGLKVPPELAPTQITHYPLIRIVPRPNNHSEIIYVYQEWTHYTHLLFTSQTAVHLFFNYARDHQINLGELNTKRCIAVGKKTANALLNFDANPIAIAKQETAEGIIEWLEEEELSSAFLFWPHSALSRPLISDWLRANGIKHNTCIFYDTIQQASLPQPDLADFDELIFTSPSTVDAFFNHFGNPPEGKRLTCIGPITQNHLFNLLN